jgi:uncharacterized membrane protein YphA (DoxX/SURF4 family)
MNTAFLSTLAMLFFSYLFVTSGYHKLFHRGDLARTISEYRILPPGWSRGVARLLPIVELGAGVALLIPFLHPAATAVVFLLMFSYTAAIAINVRRGRMDLDCGCAGPGQEQFVDDGLLVRNWTLVALALLLVLSPVSPRIPLEAIGLSLALLATVLSILVYHLLNQLLANQHKLQRLADHG